MSLTYAESPGAVAQLIAKHIPNFEKQYGKISHVSDCFGDWKPAARRMYKDAVSAGLFANDEQVMGISTENEYFGLIIIGKRVYSGEGWFFYQRISAHMFVTETTDSDEQTKLFFDRSKILDKITKLSARGYMEEVFHAFEA